MLRDRVRIIQKVFLEAAKPAINQFQQELDERRALMGLPTKSPKRRADSAALDIEQVLRAVREGLENTAPADEEGLRFVAQEIDEEVTTAADKQLSRLYNIPIASVVGSEAAVEQWIRTNVELITKMTQKQWDEIEALVSEAMSSGKPTLHLLEDIQGRFNVSYSRASLIARDQTAKLTGRINQERQTAHGITHFQWSTSGDARVRQSHADLDGQIFSWAEGAPGDSGQITPGIEYQCRCVAVPILPDDSVVEMIRESEALRERELEIMRVSPTVRGEIPNQSGFSDWNAARIAQLRKGMRSAVGLR
jgi:SPP1 gp7 family putative phage head morphogenesis protein